MIKAVFLDFYGTLVHEDGEIINIITDKILKTGTGENKNQIASFWWNEFKRLFENSYGENFITQRQLEIVSLENTIKKFKSSENAANLSELMFEHWTKPPIFEDTKEFLSDCKLPCYIVSNIDTEDVLKAIEFNEISVNGVFTSEQARSYKPRKEIFELALNSLNLMPNEVVHIGDSFSSDYIGASNFGIKALWLNRVDKPIQDNVVCVSSLIDALIYLRKELIL